MFHHLISGEMLDGCVRPLAILHNSVVQQFNIQCSVVLCGVWDNTHRGGVCDCDGVLGTRIKSQPPEANGLICLDQDQARGESD